MNRKQEKERARQYRRKKGTESGKKRWEDSDGVEGQKVGGRGTDSGGGEGQTLGGKVDRQQEEGRGKEGNEERDTR